MANLIQREFPRAGCHAHWEDERRPAYQQMVAEGQMAPGFALDDGVALHFVGTGLKCVVASRPEARAYRVARAGDGVLEEALDTLCLDFT